MGLRVSWDEAAQPDLDLPLVELFAAALAVPEGASLALGSTDQGDDVELFLRLPMPFEARAEWILTNAGTDALDVDLAVDVADGVPAAPWGRLQVQRFETNAPADGDHPLASASGRGRLVGVCLMTEGHGMADAEFLAGPLNFLEGDERGVIDGVPALRGTGTEDYLNGSFYFEDGPFAGPFAQVWDIVADPTDPLGDGQVSACRWHVLGDAVDFSSSLQLELEIGPGEPALLDRYRSVAFLYR